MHFEGQGGAVGFGKGSANVALRDTPEGTELSYEARAQVGGKLAQVGSRLIDSVAKKMTDDFFKAFRQHLVPEASADSPPSQAAPHPTSKAPAQAGATPEAPAANATAHPLRHSHDTPMVPTWWLAPAALLGAFIAIAAGRWMH